MKLKTLVEHDVGFALIPMVVSCSRCGMTMWANSKNAFVDAQGAIVCRGDLVEGEEVAE